MNGGSDYLPFLLAGIPAGGLATGAGSIKVRPLAVSAMVAYPPPPFP